MPGVERNNSIEYKKAVTIAYAHLLYHRTSVTGSLTSLLGRVLSSIHNLLFSVKCRRQQCM